MNENEPTPDLLNAYDPPEWLEGAALKKWHEVVPILVGMRVMTVADVEVVARYCALWEQWKDNYDHVKAGHGVLPIRDERGKVKYLQTTPYASQMKALANQLLRIEQEFGLTPSSRSQVTIHADRESDPLASFAAKRGHGAGA